MRLAQVGARHRRTRCATRRPMAMLHAGVDIAVIALWLGHESIETDPDLSARRSVPQRASLGRHDAARSHSWPLPTARLVARFLDAL